MCAVCSRIVSVWKIVEDFVCWWKLERFATREILETALLFSHILLARSGVFFFYEVSPLHVEIVEGYRKGYTAFFTSVCAIVGGVVTTMGMIDQFLHQRATTQKDMLLR